jgi:hypothetical protein
MGFPKWWLFFLDFFAKLMNIIWLTVGFMGGCKELPTPRLDQTQKRGRAINHTWCPQ